MSEQFIHVVFSNPIAVMRCLESAAPAAAVWASEGRDCTSLSRIIVSQHYLTDHVWGAKHGVLNSASAALGLITIALILNQVAEIILDVLAARPAFNIVAKATWKYAY